ncbi:MAG: phytanoyl-CoA dioxygenase family protein [Steroidobacteraceae bacterium]
MSADISPSVHLLLPRGKSADADHYARYGYVVVRGVVPRPQIKELAALYSQQIVPSKYPFFRQSSNAYESNKMNGRGYVRQSFLDIHDYARFPEFSRTARNIFCAPELLAALRRVSGFEAFALMQTMLFDLNTETPAHQDWYYLDSVPGGKLIAAWIALEDIDERAGRFYVMPGSQLRDFGAKTPGRTHSQWLEIIRAYVAARRSDISAPALKAGDVLLWNSRTVHGSLPTLDEAFSRKSLTAHYLPGGLTFGNLFSEKTNLPYKIHDGVRFYRNQPDFSHWNRLKFAVKTRAYEYPILRESLRKARNVIRSRA